MKILILTSVYRDYALKNRDTSTNVVNSFAREWVKMNHDVIVIHNCHRYPLLIHLTPLCFRKKIASLINFQIADYDAVKQKQYDDNGVKVYRLPIIKFIPHRSPSNRRILKQVRKIKSILLKENFIPDIITAHWASPQMEIINYLKTEFNCKTALVLHGTDYIDSRFFKATEYLKNVDVLGCRSSYQSQQIKKILNLNYLPFVCSSGIPDEYINNYALNTKKFSNIKIWKFIYVGRLVAYKNVDVVIKALAELKNVNWEFNIIGEGAEKNNLINLSKKLKCKSRIHFWGKLPRNEVMNLLKDMHVFVMVSTNEVFGLVYLEAMAASCLTIASKNGGIDGIINDSINGFLCEEENLVNLINKLNEITSMNFKELKKIVTNANTTVMMYSDSKAALRYLDNIK